MITSQLIGQVTESLIPYLMFRSRVTKVTKEGKKIVVKSADLSDSIERQSSQELYPVSYTWKGQSTSAQSSGDDDVALQVAEKIALCNNMGNSLRHLNIPAKAPSDTE